MKPHFFSGNRITLLRSGVEYFPALIAAIDQAQAEVHLESYIYADDETGKAVSAALRRAAQRGVSVCVMVDGFGSSGFLANHGYALISSGAQVLVYRPDLQRLRLRRHRLRRLHRKLAVIDGHIAFVGGINIISEALAPDLPAPRLDYAVKVEGPLLDPIRRTAHRLWRLVRWANFRRRIPIPAATPPVSQAVGDIKAAFAIRDNLRHRHDIEKAYLDAIGSAREEIVLANAYFLPGLRFRHALLDAAARGVRVIILLQGRIEHIIMNYATQALYGNLIGGGIIIHEYRRSHLHAKVAVIDGHWATVGSSNIDPFSLLMAREANIIVQNTAFAAELRASITQAIAEGSREIRAEDLRKRS
ncbi:MAG: cardiolipin synthase ClsB, partial [Zoogloeaceae bacterium]|nr:cardiolipin synthase ClsB [Zoogloeaceae bacterium]